MCFIQSNKWQHLLSFCSALHRRDKAMLGSLSIAAPPNSVTVIGI